MMNQWTTTDQATLPTANTRGISANTKHSVSGLFVFLLIAAYAMFSLLLVLIGVKAYRNVVSAAECNAQLRTTIGYISGRVRAADSTIFVTEEEGGFEVLHISNALGEEDYETRIYFVPNAEGEGGGLYEQMVEVTEEFEWDMGELIIEINHFEMEQTGDMLRLKLQNQEGEDYDINLKLLPYQTAREGGESL